MISELVKANRSCRRFYEDHQVELKTLEELVDLARLSASAANLQPLKYILACQPDVNAEIFSCLAWAGYLKDWPGPEAGERPSGYIVILGDTTIKEEFGVEDEKMGETKRAELTKEVEDLEREIQAGFKKLEEEYEW